MGPSNISPRTRCMALSRRLPLCTILLALGGFPAGLLSAQQVGSSPAVQRVGADSVSLDFRGTDVRLVISALAELAGLNVTYGNLPTTPLTLRSVIHRANARQTLDAVVRGNGLQIVEENGLLRVAQLPSATRSYSPPGVLDAGSGSSGSGGFFVYRVRHAEAESLANTLRELFGLSARASTSSTPSGSSLSRELAGQRIPLPGEETQGPPRALQGGRIALQDALSGGVQIVPDARTNSLLIRGSASDYQAVLAAVEHLDVRPLQVLVEALIVEVRRSRERGLGITLDIPDQRELETGATLGGEFAGGTAGDLVVRVLGLGAVRADVIIRALAASGDVRILSRPLILAQNNEEARISVGDQRPFIQISRELPTDSPVRDQVIQYRDVGTELTIRPTINPDGYVTLEILQEVSAASRETQFGAPVINTREAETRVQVKDRHTVVIGGLIREQEERTASGIPLLRDLPLVGRLFRSELRTSEKSELFVLLTPRVLRTDEDIDDATRTVGEEARSTGKTLRSYEPITGRDRPLQPKPEK